VVLADLAALHRNFATEASAYEQLIPSINPPAVDGGDANLNSVLTALVETFDVAHHRIADNIAHHADALKNAHESFARQDSGDTRFLYDNLMPKD
jgi:hypothetical protein